MLLSIKISIIILIYYVLYEYPSSVHQSQPLDLRFEALKTFSSVHHSQKGLKTTQPRAKKFNTLLYQVQHMTIPSSTHEHMICDRVQHLN